MASVRLSGVSRAFDHRRFGTDRGRAGLKAIDLAVAPGEIVAITGPVGAGKTTLLRVIAGLEAADAGQVFIDEESVSHVAAARRNIAMVFQHAVLMPHLNVSENITFSWRFTGEYRSGGSTDRPLPTGDGPAASAGPVRLQQVAAMLELESLLSRSSAGLSGGERQRVAIARALVRPARVVLLDEPFTNLDVTLRRRIRTRLREDVRRRQAAVLMVTHDRTDVDAMADRLAVMRDGQVEQVGTVTELRETPRSGFVSEWLEALYCEPEFGNN